MKIKDLKFENKDDFLMFTDFENFFNVSYDAKNTLNYNLNETMCLNVSDLNSLLYTVSHKMFWPLISYKLYGTTRLAWLLMKLNKVGSDSIFDAVEAGQTIRYVPNDTMNYIVQTMQN